jgi:quercetin dioxygenase-like cupin family protein
MAVQVIEDVAVMSQEQPLQSVLRDEELLLAQPHPSNIPIKLWDEHPLLSVVHFSQEYSARPFAPPRGVYENDQIRVEWQTMNNRQPFYHRNCDVDELSFQIGGERTLMTELGVVEHRAGEFSRIPRGVAHDNYGRRESHLLFYLPAPVTELAAPARLAEASFPPFPRWKPGPTNEAVTQCMGALGHDIAVFPVDETQLLNHVHSVDARMSVLKPPAAGVTWLYSAGHVLLGTATVDPGDERRYRRTLDADEIQYQIAGHRTVLSQRGLVELGPGDLVRIPLGVAHASSAHEPSQYIRLLSHLELPQVAETARTAQQYTPELLADTTAKVRS